MANCIAEAYGYDRTREKETYRLGSEAAKAIAATWDREAIAYIRRDGSGYVEVRDKNHSKTLYHYDFGPQQEKEEK